MYKDVAILYNSLLTIYFNDCNNITDKKRRDDKNNLFLKSCKYDEW